MRPGRCGAIWSATPWWRACLRLAVGLGLVGTLQGCDLDLDRLFDIPPPDCEAISRGPWQVSLSTVELQIGDSVKGRVTPGLALECDGTIAAVTWGVEDTSVASVMPLGARNPRSETVIDIARAWVSGLAPGSTMVTALVEASDGAVHEARPEIVRVMEPGTPLPGSVIVAEGTAEVRFNQFTGGGGSELIPVALPRAGRVEVTVDWTSLRNDLGFFLWEGACPEVPCPGALVIDAQLGSVKPRRETVDDLEAGEYTLRIFGVTPVSAAEVPAPETASYEIRLTTPR
jgi:hypothetical protein